MIFSKKASISVEAAIILPALILVFAIYTSKANIIYSEAVLYKIIDEKAQEASLMNIAIKYIRDFADAGSGDQIIKNVMNDLIVDTYVLSVRNSMICETIEAASTDRIFHRTIQIESIKAQENISGSVLYISCSYLLISPMLKKSKTMTIPVPIWKSRREYPGKDKTDASEDIWEEDNFKRGTFFREKYGGDLPVGYPVISGFSGGTAVSIRSIDLNKTTWEQPEDVYEELKDEIDELAEFRGTSDPWGSDDILIRNEDIKRRVLKIIIPGSSDQNKYEYIFEDLKDHGSSCGVDIMVLRYG